MEKSTERGCSGERGETFAIVFKKTPKFPFDIPGVKTKATTKDILEAIKDSRERIAKYDAPVNS